VHSYLSVLLQTPAAKKNLQALETLLVRHAVLRNGSQAAFMRALLAMPGVSPDAAYAIALEFPSLQSVLEAVER